MGIEWELHSVLRDVLSFIGQEQLYYKVSIYQSCSYAKMRDSITVVLS